MTNRGKANILTGVINSILAQETHILFISFDYFLFKKNLNNDL